MNILIKISIIIFTIGVLKTQTLDINALRTAQKQALKSSNSISNVSKKEKNIDYFISDKPVDPKKYFVGPGDHLHINIISSNETFDHNLIISPTGTLLIPSVGIIDCNKLNLSQLFIEIKKQIKSWNANVKISVELNQIREFRVSVVGQFSNAGYFIVTPMTRVSDLFKQIIADYYQKNKEHIKTNKESSFSETFGMRARIAVDDFYERKLGIDENLENDIEKLSLRNILLLRDKDTIKVDLEKFKVTGNTLYNPYIHQNDIINIPYKNRFFSVYGGVQKPGRYEYNENDKISDAVSIAGGLHLNSKSDSISITRLKTNYQSESFNLSIMDCEQNKLFPEDHIMVSYVENNEPHNIVEIVGEINYPGIYPIVSGETTIFDIIKRAGGFLPSADSSKIYINNSTLSKIPDRELERILLKDKRLQLKLGRR